MAGSITFVVVGAVAALGAGVLIDAKLPGRLARVNVKSGSVVADLLTAPAFVLPVLGVLDMSEGHPAWVRIGWMVVAFLGAGLLFAVPYRLRRHFRRKRQVDEPAEDAIVRHPVRKWRTPDDVDHRRGRQPSE